MGSFVNSLANFLKVGADTPQTGATMMYIVLAGVRERATAQSPGCSGKR